jgi:STE24 endopeptidase
MTPHAFLGDLLKQAALGIVIGTPVLLAVLWLMERMGDLWWLYVWLFWCAFNLLLLFIYPTWIAPLFNKFVPLDDARCRARVEALLARCGFTSSGLFVMDGSKRSSHGNAYFTGFGKTKRIVFFDTLLGRLQAVEVEAVLAHELGPLQAPARCQADRHAVSPCRSLFLAILGQLINADWFFNGLGLDARNTALGLLLFFLAGPVFTFLLTPLLSLLSRRDEFEADSYAAGHASAGNLVSALVKLYEDNAATLTPDPLHSLFYDSHPPAALRIARLQDA